MFAGPKMYAALLVMPLLGCALASSHFARENELDPSTEYPWHKPLACSARDCQADECAVVGMQRFSQPRCEKLAAEGSACRPGAEPETRSLYFPHGFMECDNLHVQLCPCARGLACVEGECRASAAPGSQSQ